MQTGSFTEAPSLVSRAGRHTMQRLVPRPSARVSWASQRRPPVDAARLLTPSKALPSTSHACAVPVRKPASDFHLRRGRVIDVLRESYPRLFQERPDMSIYARNIVCFRADGGGPRVRGIAAYTRMFDALHLSRRTMVAAAELQHRLHVCDDDTIRVRWAAKIWLRLPLPRASPLHVDGVSVYLLDSNARVVVHRLEFVDVLHDGRSAAEGAAQPLAGPLPLPLVSCGREGDSRLPLRGAG